MSEAKPATVKNTGRQAITTRYVGPSNVRGGRILARCDAGRISIPYDHRLGSDGNHDAAVAKLLKKLGWDGQWFGGGMAAVGHGYCYVDCSEKWEG